MQRDARELIIGALVATFFLAIAASQPVAAAEKGKKRLIVDPDETGIEYALQGEYRGEVKAEDAPKKTGVQIIARGGGKFHLVRYPGGLPGAGWNQKTKSEADGQLKNSSARFAFPGSDETAVAKEGRLVIKNADGQVIGKLKRVVRKSPTLGKKPPKNAVVLFDGSSAEHFQGGEVTDDGLLKQGATSKPTFQDCTLHLEFRLCFKPHARGQGRSNSGCYLQGRYEVQILDSFGLKGRNNECGGIYSVKAPDVNMCLPPLQWQTYDIDFTAARFKDGKKVKNARMTVRHNGVVIHKDVEVPGATTAARLKEGPQPGPIYLQDHGNPLRFRNIWVVEK